ncbi:putative glutamate--cysteine ligase regulatory subunit [Pseudocercospora fuligena]|uniref:GCS light chain n=1 Tax=Pseudocercospora fuligena TaxID=685502 RepID=A0A8H6R829_9PEZI|nr:putative glutamate--cysteine ligase regulatory subunit [Pseudocercospora fuligena]
MKLLLSTSNIMGGSSIVRRGAGSKSNTELVSSLRANFADHTDAPQINGNGNGNGRTNGNVVKPSYKAWTKKTGDALEIPALDFQHSALQEERENYDITAKLFFLPGGSKETREAQTEEAIDLVKKELHVESIDLLIVSFPGIYFDEEEDCPDKISTRGPVEAEPEPLEGQIEAWKTLEGLKEQGVVARLGVAEFGKERLETFLEKVKTKPDVNQINLRDCCSVPKDLMALAKSKSVELLVHNDCSNILPRGTTRELLGSGPTGAGVLAQPSKAGDKRKSLHGEETTNGTTPDILVGDVQPQWVIKYTAVVRNRGVVENKGYFAVAELSQE